VADKNKGRAPPPNKPGKSVTKETPAQKDWDRVVSYRRIKDVEGARTIFNRFLQDNISRSNNFAQVRNQLEGGRPWDPSEQEQQGAAWQTNINFGDAQAARDRDFLPYWQLINDVPHRAVFEIDSSSTESDKWEAAYSETFDEFHDDWASGYFIEFMKLCKNFIDFGPGIAQFQDDESPRYKSVNVQRVYWPKNTQMNPDSWEVMALVRDVGASELYGYIRDEETERQSTHAGWNVNAIKAAIVSMGQSGSGQFPDYRDFTRYQDLLVNNDIVITTPFQPLTCVWLYVKNFDGKIGCYVFPQNQGVDTFLFDDDAYADEWRHRLGVIWYDTGTDGMIHSIKGFGIKNFFFSSLLNRIKCRMVDGAAIASALNFQYGQDTMPEESPPVENYGPVNVFPGGMTQLSIYPQLQPANTVLEVLTANRDQNNALYSQQQQQIENSDTATQAKILANMQGQLNVAQASIFLAQVGSNIYTEQVRRLRKKGNSCEDAKKFVQRLRDKGVPDEVIFDVPIRVKTGANSGMANPILMVQKFQEGLQLANMPGVNGRYFLESLIAYKYGSQAVDKALLPPGTDSEPGQRREAMIENSLFGQGMDLPVAPEDAHFEHIQEHLRPLGAIVQQFKQTQTIPPEAISALAIGVEHSGKHMDYLSKDETKKQQLQAVTPAFRMIQSVARGIITRLQSQQQNPGQSPVSGGGQQGAGAQQQSAGSANGNSQKPLSESLSINFKDLSLPVQNAVLQQLGLPQGQQPPMVPARR
jgi:hypothetical protein